MSGVGKATVLILVSMLFAFSSSSPVLASNHACPGLEGTALFTSGTLSMDLSAVAYVDCLQENHPGEEITLSDWDVSVGGDSYSGSEQRFTQTVQGYSLSQGSVVQASFTVNFGSEINFYQTSESFTINGQPSSGTADCATLTDESSCVAETNCQWEDDYEEVTGTTCDPGLICEDIQTDLCGAIGKETHSYESTNCGCMNEEYANDPDVNVDLVWDVREVTTRAVCGTGACTQRTPDNTCPGGRIGDTCCSAGDYYAEEIDGFTHVCFDGTVYREINGIVDFQGVSAYAYNEQIHLCGTPPQEHTLLAGYGLCGEVNDYTCAVISQDETFELVWSQAPPYYENPSPEWTYLEDNELISPDIADAFTLACRDGEFDVGVFKYSPPPGFINSSYVPESKCIDESGDLVDQGNYSLIPPNNYVCQTLGEDSDVAEWVHVIARVADVSLSYASSDSIMNCGPAQFSANERGENNFFCQVAHLRSDSSASTIITSLHIPAFSRGLVVHDAIIEMRLLGFSIPDETDHESLSESTDENILLYDPTYFDEQSGILVFSVTQPNANPALRFYEFIRGLFTDTTAPDVELISRSGEQYFVRIQDGEVVQQAAVEYMQESDESFERYIIQTNNDPLPYTAHDWRRVIQTR